MIAAATATAASALVYSRVQAFLAAFREKGEGTLQQVRNAMYADRLSLLLLLAASIWTVILCVRLVTLRRKEILLDGNVRPK